MNVVEWIQLIKLLLGLICLLQDEVIALQDKVIIRASDLSSWLVDESEWDWGYVLPHITTPTTAPDLPQKEFPVPPESSIHLKKAFPTEEFLKNEKKCDISEIGE